MEKSIRARFTGGIFKPLDDVNIKEGTEVKITITEKDTPIKEKMVEILKAGKPVLPSVEFQRKLRDEW